ncbi:MAG: cold shock domain-containing protein [Maricaulaceae bacterium]|nr:cold shock domain-containing protein [Maricaulaceae bacterium]
MSRNGEELGAIGDLCSVSLVDEPHAVHGVVKWYDPARGYGFIDAADGQGDVLLHASLLRKSGHSFAPEGAQMRCMAIKTEKGRQAVDILSIEGGETGPARPRRFRPESDSGADLRDATVKWFDGKRGFGFLNFDGVEEDVFVHAATLRRGGLDLPQPGDVLRGRFTEGPKGLLATDVREVSHAQRPAIAQGGRGR